MWGAFAKATGAPRAFPLFVLCRSGEQVLKGSFVKQIHIREERGVLLLPLYVLVVGADLLHRRILNIYSYAHTHTHTYTRTHIFVVTTVVVAVVTSTAAAIVAALALMDAFVVAAAAAVVAAGGIASGIAASSDSCACSAFIVVTGAI